MSQLSYRGFHLNVPAGWSDETQLIALGPDRGGPRANVLVTREAVAGGVGAKGYATAQLAELRGGLPSLKVQSEQAHRAGTLDGWLREQTFVSEEGPVGQLVFYVVKSGVAFTVSFSTTPTALAAERQEAEKVFASVRID